MNVILIWAPIPAGKIYYTQGETYMVDWDIHMEEHTHGKVYMYTREGITIRRNIALGRL